MSVMEVCGVVVTDCFVVMMAYGVRGHRAEEACKRAREACDRSQEASNRAREECDRYFLERAKRKDRKEQENDARGFE